MASSSTAPQLSPVRPSSPLKMNDSFLAAGGDSQADDTASTEFVEKLRKTSISNTTDTLESGAPQTPEEAR